MSKKPVMLCIMDGFGWTPDETYGNAVAAANKPNLDKIFANYPMTTIQASGMAVGLPDGQMGNSEVGHTNMGAGRIVYQQLTLITKSIKDGEMFKNPVLVKNMKAAIDAGKAIHLMGLVGTGGVHSHADHWFGVLEMAKHMGAKDVYLHCIMDGRDTDPHSGKGFLADLQAKLDELGIGKIASVSGRYYAMDRDNNWDREEKAYAAFVYGEGNHAANAAEAIEASYAADVTDEFVIPVVTCEGGRVQDGDTVIFMNFRPDRARQMTRIFCDDNFTGFERRGGRKQVHYVCMAEYDATMPNCEVAYPPVELKNTLGGQSVCYAADWAVSGTPPAGVEPAAAADRADFALTLTPTGEALHLIPRIAVLGVGCKRGTTAEKLETAFAAFCAEHHFAPQGIVRAASIDLKKDEPGLAAFCRTHGWKMDFYTAAALRTAKGRFTSSGFVQSITGVDNVCERAAVLAADGVLFIPKWARDGVTLAVALAPFAPDWRWKNDEP